MALPAAKKIIQGSNILLRGRGEESINVIVM
jgi:hypothetical protein